jgi:Zinc carboxypeptidase.
MLIITNFAHDLDANKEKKGIAITARVHPGETQSSIVMESIIDFLTGPSPEARALRDNFIIRVC